MAEIQGTNVAAAVVPFTTEDTYPTHISEYGKGGWHEKLTVQDRDAISMKRRTIGMAVYVVTERKLYILEDGIENENWKEFVGKGTVTQKDLTDAIEEHNSSSTAHEVLFEKIKAKWQEI